MTVKQEDHRGDVSDHTLDGLDHSLIEQPLADGRWFDVAVADADPSHDGKTRPHVCTVCNKRFVRKGHLVVHQRTHTKTTVADDVTKPHSCSVCNKRFKHKHVLKAHEGVHTGHQPFQCCLCPKSYPTATKLSDHQLTHSVQKLCCCSLCEKRFSTVAELRKHMNVHWGRFACADCGKCFPSGSALRIHGRSHSKARPFECSTCGGRFTQLQSLREHERIHSGVRPYKCHICSKDFRQFGHLHSHMRLHSGEKRFQCPVCGEAFVHCNRLKRHIRTHSGGVSANGSGHCTDLNESQSAGCKASNFNCAAATHSCGNDLPKSLPLESDETNGRGVAISCCENSELTKSQQPDVDQTSCKDTIQWRPSCSDATNFQSAGKSHRCSFCGKQFTRSDKLKIHVRLHTGDKPHSCQHCSTRFTYREQLKRHLLRSHDEGVWFTCDICRKRFTDNAALKDHALRHEPVRPYVCLECPRRFHRAVELKKHHRAAHGAGVTAPQFCCGLCGNSFNRKSNVSRHFRRCAAHRGVADNYFANT